MVLASCVGPVGTRPFPHQSAPLLRTPFYHPPDSWPLLLFQPLVLWLRSLRAPRDIPCAQREQARVRAGQGMHLAGSSGRSTAGPRHTHQAAKLGWGAGHQLVPRPPAGAQRPAAAVQASAWSPPGTGRSALAMAARMAALSSFSWVPAMGLVTRQKCSRKENTVCVCDQGHFCVSEDGDDCAECRPHTPCPPGQRVRARGEPQTLGAPTPWSLLSGRAERHPLKRQTPDPASLLAWAPAPLCPALSFLRHRVARQGV